MSKPRTHLFAFNDLYMPTLIKGALLMAVCVYVCGVHTHSWWMMSFNAWQQSNVPTVRYSRQKEGEGEQETEKTKVAED